MTHNPTPPVSSRYGAPMGRHTGPSPSGEGQRWQLRRIRLDAGGYDPGGAYWGLGLPLYWCMNEDGQEAFFRLERSDYAEAYEAAGPFARRHSIDPERNTAKHIIRRDFDPGATFYR
jgi:hypothetical protein